MLLRNFLPMMGILDCIKCRQNKLSGVCKTKVLQNKRWQQTKEIHKSSEYETPTQNVLRPPSLLSYNVTSKETFFTKLYPKLLDWAQ